MTWRHRNDKIDLPRLIQLIEENGGPTGLDLHGCNMDNIDARPEALRPYLETYAQKHGPSARAPWVGQWGGSVNLSHAHLELASLRGARLEHADLRGVHLEAAKLMVVQADQADLEGAHLENADLEGARLRNARLRGAHLECADLSLARLQDAGLWGAHLENAKLDGAHLERAHLLGAYLEGARLTYARLEHADLRGANLQWVNFVDAHLENANLGRTRLSGAVWDGAFLDRTRIHRESLGEAIGDEPETRRQKTPQAYRGASEAYLLLKNNFNSIGRYEDASWAHVKEQQMQKMGCYWELRSRRGRSRRGQAAFWRWLRNWTFELLAGYGERLHMPVIWAAVVIAVFTGIYAGAGNVASGDGGATHNFLTALTHSIAAFATVGFNTLEPIGWGARLLTAIEAAFGIGLFALLVFTLGNRMRHS